MSQYVYMQCIAKPYMRNKQYDRPRNIVLSSLLPSVCLAKTDDFNVQ